MPQSCISRSTGQHLGSYSWSRESGTLKVMSSSQLTPSIKPQAHWQTVRISISQSTSPDSLIVFWRTARAHSAVPEPEHMENAVRARASHESCARGEHHDVANSKTQEHALDQAFHVTAASFRREPDSVSTVTAQLVAKALDASSSRCRASS